MPPPLFETTIFDHIFNFFGSVSDLGESWGGKTGGVLAPVLLLAFIAAVLTGGTSQTTDMLKDTIFKPLLKAATILAIVLIVVFLAKDDEIPTTGKTDPVAPPQQDTFTP